MERASSDFGRCFKQRPKSEARSIVACITRIDRLSLLTTVSTLALIGLITLQSSPFRSSAKSISLHNDLRSSLGLAMLSSTGNLVCYTDNEVKLSVC